jgi:hypothetical protein
MNAYQFAAFGLLFIFVVALVVQAPVVVLLVSYVGAVACLVTGAIRKMMEGQRAWERELRGRRR